MGLMELLVVSFYRDTIDNTAITDVIRMHNEDKDNGFKEILASASDYESQSDELSGEEEQNLGRCYF